MSHQKRVDSKDTHALKFLWWPDGNLFAKPQLYQILVHLFGATSSTSCAAFCLRQTADDFDSEFDPEISEILRSNFYVDDSLYSVETPKRAKFVLQHLSALLRKGGFNLTKWMSNSKEVRESIPIDQRSEFLLLK